MSNFLLYRSLYEDAKSGWVWVSEPKIPGEFKSGDFIKIKYEGKSVITECRIIDKYYKRRWKKFGVDIDALEKDSSCIFINYHYRRLRLDIPDKCICKSVTLEIRRVKCPWKTIVSSIWDHPDKTYRTSSILAYISIAFGLLGLIAGIFSLCSSK